MTINLKITVDTTAIEREAMANATALQKQIVTKQLNMFFNSGSYSSVEGAGHIQIRERVEQKLEQLFDDEKFCAGLNARIDKHAEEYLEIAIRDLAKDRARKVAWHAFNEHMKARDNAN